MGSDHSGGLQTESTTFTPLSAAGQRGAEHLIGRYRIIRTLGQGGMGVVYEAEQESPRRRVAIKIMRPTFVGARPDQLALFRREADALARLKHPCIAAIYLADQTEQGEPFLVMELVSGEPLSEYIARIGETGPQPRSLRAQLALYIKICEAVNYAHQRGVIHRDLKPSNIIVGGSPDNPAAAGMGAGEVKVLDFGIARFTDAGELTATGLIRGSPAYMSPEQASGDPAELDLRSDIYSLGVLLYELLTGKMPYHLPSSSPVAVLYVVSTVAPTPPSKVWREAGARMDRDLDAIVLKALEKDPARRYQTAQALAEDIQHYLDNEPVQARHASAGYRFRKLVTRNKLASVLIASMGAIVVTSAAVAMVQSRNIARQAKRADQEATTSRRVSDFLVGLFSVSDPSEARGRTVTAREILDSGAVKITRELANEPVTAATLMHTMGRVYQNLGLYDRARPLAERAFSLRRTYLGDTSVDVGSSLRQLGELDFLTGSASSAAGRFQKAIRIHEASLGPENAELAADLDGLGVASYTNGDNTTARPLLERALRIRQRVLGDHRLTAETLGNLAVVVMAEGDFKGAVPLFQRAIAMVERLGAGDDPVMAGLADNYAATLAELGRFDERDKQLERAVAIYEKSLGPENDELSRALGSLANAYLDHGRTREALALEKRRLAIVERVLGPTHRETGYALTAIGNIYRILGEYSPAESFALRGARVVEGALGPNNRETAFALHTLGIVYRDAGQNDKADAALSRALAIRQRVLGPKTGEVATSLESLAIVNHKRGGLAAADGYFNRALALRLELAGPEDSRLVWLYTKIADLRRTQGRSGDADSLYRLAIRIGDKTLPPSSPDIANALDRYAQLMVALGREDSAAALKGRVTRLSH